MFNKIRMLCRAGRTGARRTIERPVMAHEFFSDDWIATVGVTGDPMKLPFQARTKALTA